MTLKEIYQFFQNPPVWYLNQEQATCFVLNTLLQEDSYGTELVQLVERNYPPYRLSDTILYGALKFLLKEGLIRGYSKKVDGRGRPRQMYQIFPEKKAKAEELAHLWQEYVNRNGTAIA
ncbi:PadR family transcriptional regulator [Leptothermofonsia sp. ETS-13]|uniref:PadR family transcriptional regulator n=1 Tax=Leptothermofonsia sp. ETS-13 TaxID=3035696 RepID=UPI003BA29FC0